MLERLQKLRSSLVRWRLPLTVCGGLAFVVCLGLAIASLQLSPQDIRLGPLLLVLLVLAPVNLAVAGATLQLSARAVGCRMGFRQGVVVSAVAGVAEVLPAPGGGIVRGAALMRLSASLAQSTWVITASAIMTLSMTALLAAMAVLQRDAGFGAILLAAGAGGLTAAWAWMWRRAGGVLAAQIAGIRLLTLGIGVLCVAAAFEAIGNGVGLRLAALFLMATTLGSAVSVIPAGLGVNELLAAAIAGLIDMPPGAAFVAVALNRILALTVSGTLVVVSSWLGGPRAVPRS